MPSFSDARAFHSRMFISSDPDRMYLKQRFCHIIRYLVRYQLHCVPVVFGPGHAGEPLHPLGVVDLLGAALVRRVQPHLNLTQVSDSYIYAINWANNKEASAMFDAMLR